MDLKLIMKGWLAGGVKGGAGDHNARWEEDEEVELTWAGIPSGQEGSD